MKTKPDSENTTETVGMENNKEGTHKQKETS
jgi:hypothetical protein